METKNSATGNALSKSSASAALVVSKWLVIFCETFKTEPNAERSQIWHKIFDGKDPGEMELACSRVVTECKFFPVPAEIIERLTDKAKAAKADKCLVEWEAILEYCKRGWHPDVGWSGTQPKISAQAEYALRHVGGWIGLARAVDADEQNTVWRKRDFEEGYARFSEMESVGYTPLSQSQARELLGKIRDVKQIADRS